MKKQCYIYVVSNPAFKGWFKIGRTTNITTRLCQYNTSDPLRRFKVEYIVAVNNPVRFEKFIRDHSNSEWTQINLSDLLRLISAIKETENKRFCNTIVQIDDQDFEVKSYRTTVQH